MRRETRVSLFGLVLFLSLVAAAGPASAECIERGSLELCADTDGFYVDIDRASAVLDFGDVPVGDRRTFELQVTNRGDETVAVADVGIRDDRAGAFSTDAPSRLSLAPGQQESVSIAFEPVEPGNASARLGFLRGDRAGSIDLLGAGTVPSPELSLSPRTLAFADAPVGQTTTKSVTFENAGEGPLEVTGVEVTGDDAFSVRGETQVRIAPGERHEVQVAYAREGPTPASATVEIRSNDPEAPIRTVYASSAPVTTSVEREDGRTRVEMEVAEVPAGESVEMAIPDDGADEDFELERMGVTPAADGAMSMTMTTSADSLDTSPAFEPGDGTTPMGWFSVDHSMPNADIEQVTYTYRVSTDRLAEMDSSPEDVSLFRFEDDGWVAKETSVVRRGDGFALLQTTAAGMSEWTAAARRPRLNVTDSSVSLRTATTDEAVTIQVFVENTGGTDGVYDARLLLNGETVERRERTVPDGGTVAVNFERTFGQPGQYAVRVNDVFVGQVNVSAADGSAAVRTDGSPAGNGQPAGDGGGGGSIPVLPVGVALVALAGVGLWYYLAE